MTADLLDSLQEVWEYFDQRADADCVGDPAQFVPNTEMKLRESVSMVMTKLELAKFACGKCNGAKS